MLGGQRLKEQMKKKKASKGPSGVCISAAVICMKPFSQKYGNREAVRQQRGGRKRGPLAFSRVTGVEP